MKANINMVKKLADVKSDGPFHGHELRLTIGLIVKNEEKTLDKCLSSLVPLLKAVPSELIITDTGSTDSTVEIAQKYTDNIIHFEWCDDFSAARNTGLDAARGEWFLYLDGDEWFDDVTELVNFFNSGECDQYGAMAYIQRNYIDLLGDSYGDVYVCRSFRRFPESRFCNKVHEDFAFHEPMKVTDAFVHHYGYVFRNEEERRNKYERNEKLLKNELKANPDDLKAILQYTNQIVERTPELAVRYSEYALEIVKRKNPGNILHAQTRFAYHMAMADFNCHRYNDVFSISEEALKKESKIGVFHLELYRLCQMAAWQLSNYEAVIKYGGFYRNIYPQYQNDQLDRSVLPYEVFHYLTPVELQKTLVMTGQACLKLCKIEEARNCLESLDLTAKNSMQNGALPLCTDLASQAEDWDIAVDFYRRVLALDDEGKKDALLRHLNAYYVSFPSKQREMLLAFANSEGSDTWIQLCKLRVAEQDTDRKKVTELLEQFCQGEEQWNAYFSDILWIAMKEKKNLIPFLSHVNTDVISAMAMDMQATHEDYSSVIGDYFELFSFENAKAISFAACLLERAVLSKNAKENTKLYRKLIDAYLENLSKFVRAVYRPDVLTEAGLSALLHVYRFGYYAGLALDAKRLGDDAAYLANLRLGLKEYPMMKSCVEFLLKEFEEEQKKRDAKAEEFSVLAKQVKQNIEQLIMQGDLKQAGAYTLQLAKLIPEDDDVRRYRKLTSTEPTMAELASHLPQ